MKIAANPSSAFSPLRFASPPAKWTCHADFFLKKDYETAKVCPFFAIVDPESGEVLVFTHQ